MDKCCISVNSKCNLACKYCHFYENPNLDMSHIKELDSKKILRILQNIYDYCLYKNIKRFSVGFAGGGEPLLNYKDIFYAIKEIAKIDSNKILNFYIITNAVLLNDRILNEYKDLKPILNLVVSLDGDNLTHNENRIFKNKSATFDIIMQNLKIYKNLFNEMPPINMVVSKISLINKEKILNFLQQNDFKNLTFTRLFHCDNKSLEISHNEFIEYLQYFSKFNFNIRNIDSINANKCDCIMYGNTCGVGINNIFYFNDKVYPCMRFSEDSKWAISDYNDSLFNIESKMQNLYKPHINTTQKSECYYEKY